MSYTFSKDDFEKMQEFIYRKVGIRMQKNKYYEKLNNYICNKCKSLNIENFNDYFHKLRFDDTSADELQSLINVITINDTYFFREKDQFKVLISHILPSLNNSVPKNRPIRILSSACSTGEEIYSIALHIVEEGNIYKKRDIEILGIDIDSNAIQKAKDGIFSKNTVETVPKNILKEYFVRDEDSYHISSDLVKMVDFKVVNVFEREKMLDLGKFDVIFSRNMLIYFDDSSRKEVAMNFHNMLTEDGLVLLGEAENMNRIVSLFNSKKIEQTTIYKK